MACGGSCEEGLPANPHMPRKHFPCLAPPGTPFDTAAAAHLFTQGMAGSTILLVDQLRGRAHLEQEKRHKLTYVCLGHNTVYEHSFAQCNIIPETTCM